MAQNDWPWGRAVIRRPDLLLIDEPTNHLDIEEYSMVWREMLRTAPFRFRLSVSHDRYFLEQVTNRVLELNPVYPDGYFSVSGTYSMFLEKRVEFLESQRAQQVTLANIVRREACISEVQSQSATKPSQNHESTKHTDSTTNCANSNTRNSQKPIRRNRL